MQRYRDELLWVRSVGNPTLAAVLKYQRLGLHLMPINPDTKVPLIPWKVYQDQQPTVAELVDCWERWPRADVGLITGKGSGVVILDVDPANGGSLDGLVIPPDAYIERTLHQGWHIGFRHPGQYVKTTAGQIRPGLDVRGDGGYAKIYPSRGYTIESGVLDPQRLPMMPAWMVGASAGNGQRESTRENPPGWFELLLREPAPAGERRTRALRLSGYLLRHLSQSETLALLLDWWRRCAQGEHPFPESELVTVVAEMAAKEAAKGNGHDPNRPVLRLYRPRDLPDIKVEFVVEGLVPKDTLSVLFGPDKEGKTLLCQNMVQAVRHNQLFLDRFSIMPGPVIMLLLDDPPALTRERLIDHLGLGDDDELYIATHLDADTDDVPRLFDALREEILTRKPVLVVLDALYVLLAEAEQLNQSGGMRQIMRRLDRIAEETHTAILLVHHARRSDQEIAGSFVIRASAKSILRLIKPRDAKGKVDENTTRRLLRVEGKYLPQATYMLDLIGPGQWTLLGDARQVRMDDLTMQILEVLGAKEPISPGLTCEEIASQIQRRPADVLRSLTTLKTHRKVSMTKVKQGRGRPKELWLLVLGATPPTDEAENPDDYVDESGVDG